MTVSADHSIEASGKERVALWDNLKFLLILLVVVGHFADPATATVPAYQSLFIFIYSFHMPLFIFIIGLFHRNTNVTQRVLFFVSIGFLQKILFYFTHLLAGTPEMGFELLADKWLPWFMFAIAAYTLLLYLLRNFDKRYLLVASIVLACFAGYDQQIGDFLYLSRIIVFLPFYIAGTMLDPRSIAQRKRSMNKGLVLLGIVVLAAWACICFLGLDGVYPLRHLLTGRNPFSTEILAFGPLVRLFCYGVSFATGAALILAMPTSRLAGITRWGSHSLDVYFWHWAVFVLLEHFFGITGLLGLGPWGQVVFLLIPIPVTIVLSLGGPISYPLATIKRLCKPVRKA